MAWFLNINKWFLNINKWFLNINKWFSNSNKWFLKGELKPHIHISLHESNTLQEYDAVLLFLSVVPWGKNFAYCYQPAQPLAAPDSSHVLQLLSAVTQWVAVPLPAPTLWAVNHRLQCSSQEISSKFALKLVSNRKLLKSCASIGCTKRQVSRVSFHIFPVGKVRQKQWLASLKLSWSMHLLYFPFKFFTSLSSYIIYSYSGFLVLSSERQIWCDGRLSLNY